MARTPASLPAGSRITDYISIGVVTKAFPLDRIRATLAATRKQSIRQRDLPAHVVVYYVIALALYMQSSYREVLRCLLEGISVAGGTLGGNQRGWQLRDLAGADQTGVGAASSIARRSGEAGCGGGDEGRMVSGVASGEYRRKHAGCRRREGQ